MDLQGNDGNDHINADDSLQGEVEDIGGGIGAGTIDAIDGEVDNIDCGPGNDTVNFGPGIDAVAGDC